MKAISLLIPLTVLATALFFSTCTGDKAYPQYGNYPSKIGEIFINKCATSGCHNSLSKSAAGGLDLSTWANLFKGDNIGSPVIPYRSDFSSLCFFINSYSDLGPVNAPRMPLDGSALSHDEVRQIKDWIDAGAPDSQGNIMWANNPHRKKVYVVNQGCDVVTVFDSQTQLPMRYITVGNKPNIVESPHMVRVSPDGQYWYVIFIAGNILQKYRTSDDSFVGEVTLGNSVNWNTFVITNDGKKAFCVCWQPAGRVASVNLDNMTLIKNLGGFNQPHGVALNPSQDTLYITAQVGNCLFKVDTAISNVDYVPLDATAPDPAANTLQPHELVFSPDGSKLFVSCQNTNQVVVLRTSDNAILQTVTTGNFPQELVVSPSSNKVYISCMYDSTMFAGAHGVVTAIDMTSLAAQHVKVGFLPHGLDVDENTQLIYVASRNILSNGPAPHHTGVCGGRNGFVSYIKMSTLEVLKNTTEVAADPYFVCVRP